MRRMETERECVGDIGTVDAPIVLGREVVEGEERDVVVDGWLLRIVEAKRIKQCELCRPHMTCDKS